jgi:RNA polymerase sigma factor (sigma-70 family)
MQGTSRPEAFNTTSWTLVMEAARPGEKESLKALSKICQVSWYPIYAFIRRLGYNQADAEDLAQGFFEHVLQNNVLAHADKERGRFRSFLLGSLRNFVSNEERKYRAEKRGGRVTFVSVDAQEGEDSYQREIAHPETPEKIFQRSWAEQLLQRALDSLKADYERANKLRMFEALYPYLTCHANPPSYQELAETLKMSSGTVAVAVFRMRKRYGELLRKEIALTVEDQTDVEQEIRVLLEALAA